jgi:hypothetical protein
MHEVRPDGTVIASYCDFCRARFGDAAMVEGHQGSLICLSCLTVAYAEVALGGGGQEHAGKRCTLCLEERSQAQWESPAAGGARACLRCIRQAATALEKDPETGWRRPG